MADYKSVFTGNEMDARLGAVAQLQAAITQMEAALAAKYTIPTAGIPSSDMDAAVQTALGKAMTAVQSLADYYTKAQVDAITAAIAATVNSTAGVTAASLPAASADTLGKIYYIGPSDGEYDRYVTSYDGSTYSWLPLGSTALDLSQYATSADLDALEAKVADIENGVTHPEVTLSTGAIKTDGTIGTSANYKHSDPIALKKGQTIFVKSAGYSFSVVSAYDNGTYTPLILVTSNPGTGVLVTYKYTADADMYVCVSVNVLYSYDIYLSSESADTARRMAVDGELLRYALGAERVDKVISKGVDMTQTAMYINSSNVWAQSSRRYASYTMPVKAGQMVTMVARNNQTTRYALVSSIGASGASPSFVDMTSRQEVNPGEQASFIVKHDCILWVYNAIDSNTYVFPSKLVVSYDSVDNAENAGGITRFAVNLVDEGVVVSGTLSDTGALETGSSRVTDFLPIYLGMKSYEKTQYIHACGYVDGVFAFGAQRICTYGATQEFIGYVDSIDAALDKESVDNASIFADARYIRVQFASGTSRLYVACQNNTLLPEYSVYDKDSLTATKMFNADKVRNSDGAITNMIRTALDYVNAGSVTQLGYGDSNTAFDQTVNAVTPDPWNSDRYTGEHKQINCSAFVQLCLQGIRFLNSRYVSGSEGINYGINGYRFDSKTEWNYHNAVTAERRILASNYEKLYAHKMCKYAYDRGFFFLLDRNFRNVETGDVIFSIASGQDDAFLSISHVSFVSGVNLKKDGTKSAYIMQVLGSSINNLAHETLYSTPNENMRYVARFPLPDVTMAVKDIVASFESHTVTSVAAGSSEKVADITLSENISAQNVYTLRCKASSIPAGAEIVLKAGNTVLGSSGETLFVRGDNVTVKHFHLLYGSSVNTNALALYVVAHGDVTGTINMESVELFKGYVTC